jgi:CDP-diacylglycerol--glycerol-3-phosphate 3-phosphatidyltransferase
MPSLEQRARDISRPALEAVARRLAHWNISPNFLTYFGLLLTAGVATLAGLGELRWAGLAYIFAAIFDALDGTLARVSGKGSRFGAFLDSTIDRFEESAVFLGLIIHYALVGAFWEIPVTALASISSLMVSYTRARAEGVGVACKEGLMTRPVRVVILIAGMLLDQMLITLGILAVAALATAIHRMIYVWQMTGGEAGGWEPSRAPYAPPGPPVKE